MRWLNIKKLMVLSLFSIFLIGFAKAELSLTIYSETNGFKGKFITETDSNSSTSFDGFDKEVNLKNGAYIGQSNLLYSNISGKILEKDVWPSTSNSRSINLVFDPYLGNLSYLNLSWNYFGSEFSIILADYGEDSNYSLLVNQVNMEEDFQYYIKNLTGKRYFILLINGVGESSELENCDQEKSCNDWSTCQNLEDSFNEKAIPGADYLTFKTNCSSEGLSAVTCGFQIRECNWTSFCKNMNLIKKSQTCYFLKDPSCSDQIKDCHQGSCEENIDCGGPCSACPTCSDGIKNQGENNVDCGGPCQNQCKTNKFNIYLSKKTIYFIYIILAIILIVLLILNVWKLINMMRVKQEDDLKWYKL